VHHHRNRVQISTRTWWCISRGVNITMSLRVLATKANEMRKTFGPSAHLDMICAWTQDPDVCYAFESSAGAAWWARHGGPQSLCKTLEARHVPTSRPPVPVAQPQAPLCFACSTPLCGTMLEPLESIVVKCGCRSKIIHTGCAHMFDNISCVFCEQPYSTCPRAGRLLPAGVT
jgi:hypothetical protein